MTKNGLWDVTDVTSVETRVIRFLHARFVHPRNVERARFRTHEFVTLQYKLIYSVYYIHTDRVLHYILINVRCKTTR